MAECPFCAIVDGKIPANKVYEDDFLLAILDINPANKGHIILLPKPHIKSIMEMSEEAYFRYFVAARGISLALLKFGAQGINFLYPMGSAAGQRTEHMVMHIIPRFDGDNKHIQLVWQPQKFSEEDFKRIRDEIVKNLPQIPKSAPKSEGKEEVIKEKEVPEVKYRVPEQHGGYW